MKGKRFTIKFNCKQYGASVPDIKTDKLELTKQVESGFYHNDTYTVQIYDEDREIAFTASMSGLKRAINIYKNT